MGWMMYCIFRIWKDAQQKTQRREERDNETMKHACEVDESISLKENESEMHRFISPVWECQCHALTPQNKRLEENNETMQNKNEK